MQDVGLEGGAVELVGALDLDRSATGIGPRRLPAWTRPQLPSIVTDVIVKMPSGVRLRMRTDTTTIELDVQLTLLQMLPRPLAPAVFDLVVDGELVAQSPTTTGNVLGIDHRLARRRVRLARGVRSDERGPRGKMVAAGAA